MAKDKIPTSRVSRTAKIGGLAAGQAIRQAGTRAANVTRTQQGKEAALERRHIEAAEQIVAALGTMKGAAMKVGSDAMVACEPRQGRKTATVSSMFHVPSGRLAGALTAARKPTPSVNTGCTTFF